MRVAASWGVWLVLLPLLRLHGQPWPCPFGCWVLPGTAIQTFGMWACDACRCSYGTYDNGQGDCTPCPLHPKDHMVPIPTTLLSDCNSNLSNYMCDAGYYKPQPDATDECVPCARPQAVPPCPIGSYRERCQPPEGPFRCLPCTQPPLPNPTAYAYGTQRELPLCDTDLTFYPPDQSCALFQTPSWDRYLCAVYCNVGFTNVNPQIDASIMPDCRPCIEVCGLGYACSDVTNTFRNCIPCMDLNNGVPLPPNARWLPDCFWACMDGYYVHQNECVPCAANQACFSPTQRFMGCTGDSPGRCTSVDFAACEPNITYLHYEVYSTEATCVPCSQPVLNATYLVAECTQMRDTQLRTCTERCPRPGFFISRECTLTADIQCQPCTVGTLGQLMVQECGVRSDARFVPCPPEGACDGSATVWACPPPKLPRQGRCVCPPATQLEPVQGACIPIQCPSGWYPNASTNACSPCGDALARTLPMRIGLEACACPPGFFLQQSSDDQIRCWPCGDLQCTPGLQRQSQCPGDTLKEPECVCQLPPGAELLDPEACTFACAPGLDTNADLVPAWWTPDPFVSAPAASSLDLTGYRLGDGVLVAPDVAVLAVVDEGDASYSALLIVVYKGRSAHTLNASAMLIQGTRERLASPLLRLWASPTASRDRFWIGFSFETRLCAGVETPAAVMCSTLELVQVFRNASCTALQRRLCAWTRPTDCETLPLCIALLDTGIWGNTMQAGFRDEFAIRALAGTDTALYLLLGNGCVHAYPLHFYAPDTPQSQRGDDRLQNLSMCSSSSSTAALAVLGNTLYIAGRTQGPAEALFVVPSDAQAVWPLSSHWLLLRDASGMQRVVDIWNGLSWPSESHLPLLASAWGVAVWTNGSHLYLTDAVLPPPCPLDTLRYKGSCARMPCVRLRGACGPNSLRLLGTTVCVCAPGFYRSAVTLACVLCPANAYCPGNTVAPLPCGADAVSQPGAATVTECLCREGYYPYLPTLCLPCPIGFWCLGARTLPIPCVHGGTTPLPGARTPLACLCPPRTHGLLCTPCTDDELCVNMATRPQLIALRVVGWAPATFNLAQCTTTTTTTAAAYSLPAAATPTRPGPNVTSAWLFVMVSDSWAQAAFVECLQASGLQLGMEPPAPFGAPQTPLTFRTTSACGLNAEWAGDAAGTTCTCIAGYFSRRSPRTGFDVCVPCPNGTIRPRRSPLLTSCTPCPDNRSHAPWRAMSRCVCPQDAYFDLDAQRCLPTPPPPHTSPALALSLSVLGGLLCMLALIIAPRLILVVRPSH
jgi:hypothetical protein